MDDLNAEDEWPAPADQWAELERHQHAARIAGLGHYVWDVAADRCILCSKEHASLHGMGVKEYIAQSSTTDGLAHPDDLPVVRRAFERLRAGQAFEVEFRIVTPCGDVRFIREIGHPVFDDEGAVVQEIGTSQEITRQKHLEATLRDTEETLFAGIEALPLGFAAYDADGRLKVFNQEYRRLLSRSGHLLKPGLELEELLRHSADTIAAAQGYPDTEAYIRDWTGTRGAQSRTRIYRQSTGRWIKLSSHPNDSGGFISLMEDITELKAQEDQLRQAQKMEAVGQLTGGVAHDFNNLLAVIQGNAELLQELDPELAPLADDIVQAARRGAELTQGLLAFSRRQVLTPKPLDLSELVAGFVRILDRTLGESIAIRFSSDAAVEPAFADRAQVETVLLNLALNARDAMPNGGLLSIRCTNAVVDAFDAARIGDAWGDLAPGDYVVLSVTDTGVGMTADQSSRAFDPFYTTKGIGEGSGLGLSMVYGFAKQSGGHARIKSADGQGTTVELLLPRATEDLPKPRARSAETFPRGQGEDILVIEDDPGVRQLVCRMLLGLGYSPLSVRDARMGREAIGDNPSLVLVVCDVVLPGGISGPELANELHKDGSRLEFLFMSGYSREASERAHSGAPLPRFLMKPFSQADLLVAVRDALLESATRNVPNER